MWAENIRKNLIEIWDETGSWWQHMLEFCKQLFKKKTFYNYRIFIE